MRVTATEIVSPPPKKFLAERVKVNSTPISSALELTVARRNPWKGASALSTAATAAPGAAEVFETCQEADSCLDAAPDDARPSRLKFPHSPIS